MQKNESLGQGSDSGVFVDSGLLGHLLKIDISVFDTKLKAPRHLVKYGELKSALGPADKYTECIGQIVVSRTLHAASPAQIEHSLC